MNTGKLCETAIACCLKKKGITKGIVAREDGSFESLFVIIQQTYVIL